MREAVRPAGLCIYLRGVADACINMPAAAQKSEVARGALDLEFEFLPDLRDSLFAALLRRLGERVGDGGRPVAPELSTSGDLRLCLGTKRALDQDDGG